VPPSLIAIFAVFARYANLTLGGGSATIAVLRDQIVEKRRWVSELQFNLAYALSRLTPGTNLLAFCAATGWIVRRSIGALVALLAASLPCSALVLAVTAGYELWQKNPIVVGGLRGAMAAAVAIMINTAWVLARPHMKASPVRAMLVLPAAALLSTVAAVSPVKILLGAAVLGALWPAREESA
jgi:chromate transporter